MQELQQLERRLLAGIPYRYRYEVEAILRAFQQSVVMLEVYSQAVRVATPAKVGETVPNPIVVAFGSFGRLDGAANISDYDVLFLYDGDRNPDRVNAFRSQLRDIVSSNQALMFDHRAAIQQGSFDFDASPAYPILSVEELFRPESEVRALQLLMEGRCLSSNAEYAKVAERLVATLGFAEVVHRLNLAPLRAALSRLKTAYCTGVVGRLRERRTALTNRKILKLFALREFSHLAALFALAETAIAVSAECCNAGGAVRTMSAPSVLKIASFGDSLAALSTLLSRRSPQVKRSSTTIVDAYIDKLRPELDGVFADPSGDDTEEQFTARLRLLTLNVLRHFNSLLQLLHDVDFLCVIDPLEPDITTWMSYKQFRHVLDRRHQLIVAAKELASALKEIVGLVARSSGCPALDDAQASLEDIVNYKLEFVPRVI
jgi:hypothetical protein